MAGKKKRSYTKKNKNILPSTKQEVVRIRSMIMPDTLITRLPYADNGFNHTTGTFSNVYSFRLNSPYDPDYSGGGHQPMGWDEFIAFYERYTVTSCYAELTFMTPSGADPCQVAIVPSSFQTTPLDMGDAREMKNSISFVVMPGERPYTVKKLYNMAQLFGTKDLNDDLYRTSVTTNPADDAYLNIYAENAYHDASAVNLYLEVKFYFTTKFSTMRLIGGS